MMASGAVCSIGYSDTTKGVVVGNVIFPESRGNLGKVLLQMKQNTVFLWFTQFHFLNIEVLKPCKNSFAFVCEME